MKPILSEFFQSSTPNPDKISTFTDSSTHYLPSIMYHSKPEHDHLLHYWNQLTESFRNVRRDLYQYLSGGFREIQLNTSTSYETFNCWLEKYDSSISVSYESILIFPKMRERCTDP